MPAIVAPTVCRFTLNGTYSGHNIANIWDIHIDTTGTITSRHDAIVDQAEILLHEFDERILDLVVNDYSFTSVSWVDLNTSDGETGEITSGGGTALPTTGDVTTAPSPGNVAMLIGKRVSTARQFRSGRSYLCGIAEADTDDSAPNILEPTAVPVWQAAWDGWFGAVNQEGGGVVDYSSQLVVVHTIDGVFDSYSEVEELIVESTLATQRRRLRR